MDTIPNEIIYQFYQYLNPNDQLKLSAVSKIFRDCLPDWKRNHQKSFSNCVNQINGIKYSINNWRGDECSIFIDITKDRPHNSLVVTTEYNCNSQILLGENIIQYSHFSSSGYLISDADNANYLLIKKGPIKFYDLNKQIHNHLDMTAEKTLKSQTRVYRHIIY